MRKFQRKFCKKVALPIATSAIVATTVLAPVVPAFANEGEAVKQEVETEAVEEKVEQNLQKPEEVKKEAEKTEAVEEKVEEKVEESLQVKGERKTEELEARLVSSEPTAVEGLIYDGEEHALCNPGSAEDAVFQYSTNGRDWSDNVPTGKNAGKRTVFWREWRSREVVASGSFDVTIAKAKIVSLVVLGDDRVYNGWTQEIDEDDVEILTDSGIVVPSNYIQLSGALKGTNAGTYQFNAKIKNKHGDNFDTSIVLDGAFTIGKKELTADLVEIEKDTYQYDGKVKELSMKVSDKYYAIERIKAADYTTSGTKRAREIGTYTVTVSATESGNYYGSVDVDWYIAPEGVAQVPVGINSTYNGESQALLSRPGELTSGDMYYKLSTSKNASTHIPEATDAGTYVVEYGYKWKGDFHKLGEVTSVIEKADIGSVSIREPKEFVYNAKEQGYDKTELDVLTVDGMRVPVDNIDVAENKATAAGEYSLTVTARDDSKNFKGTTSVGWKIDKAKIEIASIYGADKIYDGTKIGAAAGLDAELKGVCGEDAVVLLNVLEYFEDKNVGNDKPVTFIYGLASLDGEGSENYYLDTTTAPETGTASITPKEISNLYGINVVNKVYDGNTEADVRTGLAEFKDIIPGDGVSIYDVKGFYNDDSAGIDKEVKLDYTDAKLGGLDSPNYTFVKSGYTQEYSSASIIPKALTEDMVQYDGVFTWDGEQHFPELEFVDMVDDAGLRDGKLIIVGDAGLRDGKNIITKDDVTYEVVPQKDVGTYSIRITAELEGNYAGYVDVAWVITPVGDFEYDIIDGDGTEYWKKSKDSVVVVSNGPANLLSDFLIDGKALSTDNYVKLEGSTVVAIAGNYLDTLEVGSHTFQFKYEDGVSNVGTITIKSKRDHHRKDDKGGNRKDDKGGKGQARDQKKQKGVNTGDYTSTTAWSTALIVSAAAVGVGSIVALKLRKKEN